MIDSFNLNGSYCLIILLKYLKLCAVVDFYVYLPEMIVW